MVRVTFCIGGYPPKELKRRADVVLSYANSEIEVGVVTGEASRHFYGMTPTEIQLVAPAFIDAARRVEKDKISFPLCSCFSPPPTVVEMDLYE